jgi:hypothetical protein
MNKRRLAAIARWLEAGAPEKKGVVGFDMGELLHFEDCGAVCCIAGAAMQFFGDKQNHYHCDYFGGLRLLGLNDVLGNQLCSPKWHAQGPDPFTSYKEVSPAWAARVIRKLIKTGVVDWAGCKNE